MSLNVHHRNIWSQEPNLFHCERKVRILVNRVEDTLVRALDRGAALDVHAVDNYVIGILGKRFRENGAALRIPTSLHLLHAFAYRSFVRRAAILCWLHRLS